MTHEISSEGRPSRWTQFGTSFSWQVVLLDLLPLFCIRHPTRPPFRVRPLSVSNPLYWSWRFYDRICSLQWSFLPVRQPNPQTSLSHKPHDSSLWNPYLLADFRKTHFQNLIVFCVLLLRLLMIHQLWFRYGSSHDHVYYRKIVGDPFVIN